MKLLATLSLGLLLALGAMAPANAAPTDDRAIRAVIETFRTALISRDKARFVPLFLHEKITWQAVMADTSLARIRAKRPQAIKARVFPDQTWLSFIDGIVADPKRNEETFSNIVVDSDGDAASVAFDYVYLYDGQESNHGREYWHLVRTEDGWKIASVVYSIVLPPPAS